MGPHERYWVSTYIIPVGFELAPDEIEYFTQEVERERVQLLSCTGPLTFRFEQRQGTVIVPNANDERILVDARRRPVGCNADQIGTRSPELPSNRLVRYLGCGIGGAIAADILATHGAVRRLHQKRLEAFGGRLL